MGAAGSRSDAVPLGCCCRCAGGSVESSACGLGRVRFNATFAPALACAEDAVVVLPALLDAVPGVPPGCGPTVGVFLAYVAQVAGSPAVVGTGSDAGCCAGSRLSCSSFRVRCVTHCCTPASLLVWSWLKSLTCSKALSRSSMMWSCLCSPCCSASCFLWRIARISA